MTAVTQLHIIVGALLVALMVLVGLLGFLIRPLWEQYHP